MCVWLERRGREDQESGCGFRTDPFQQHFPGAGHVEHAVCPMESYDRNVVWLLIIVSAVA